MVDNYLEVKEVKKTYKSGSNSLNVLNGVNLRFEQGKIYILLGPSGSGKSTLLNIIGGLDRPDSGKIILNNQVISDLSNKELNQYRRNKLGFVFQSYNLINELNVYGNVEVGAYLSDSSFDVEEIVTDLGINDKLNKYPTELSGGEQQRVSIGRAVVKNPSLLLCDEPTGALDYENSITILELLETINQKYNTTMILVTHNEEIGKMGDYILRMHNGIVEDITKNMNKVSANSLVW